MTASKTTDPLTHYQWMTLLVIVLLAAGLRFYELGRAPLWLDEQCQLAVAQTPTLGACWHRAGELGPIGPLSFFESWIVWHLGGATRAWFRLPPALWGTATAAMVFVLGRRWFSTTTGLYLAALLAVSGIHIQFSREARGYALLVLLSVVWVWLLDKYAQRPGWLSGIILLLLAETSLYVHPAFLIVMVTMGATMMIVLSFGMKQPERVSIQSAMSGICGIVLAAALLYWIVPRPLPLSTTNKPESASLIYLLMDIYKQLLGGYWGILSYAIFALSLAGGVAGLRNERTRGAMLCALALSAAGIAPIVAGHLQGAAVFARYSLFALPFLLMLPAYGADVCTRRMQDDGYQRPLSAVILAALLMIGMYIQHRSPYDLERFKVSNPDWPSLDV